MREIARATTLQPNSAHRTLKALERERLVKQDSDGRFSLGLELVRLGQAAASKLDIRNVAEPHLRELAASASESAFLGLLGADQKVMMRVLEVPSPHPLKYVVELFRWTDIFRGASGLAMMAFLPEPTLTELLDEADAHADDDSPWLQRTSLERTLDQIRIDGFAYTRGRRIPGAVGFASPILGSHDQVLGDVILTIPETRFDEARAKHYGSLVRVTSTNIMQDLGITSSPSVETTGTASL